MQKSQSQHIGPVGHHRPPRVGIDKRVHIKWFTAYCREHSFKRCHLTHPFFVEVLLLFTDPSKVHMLVFAHPLCPKIEHIKGDPQSTVLISCHFSPPLQGVPLSLAIVISESNGKTKVFCGILYTLS